MALSRDQINAMRHLQMQRVLIGPQGPKGDTGSPASVYVENKTGITGAVVMLTKTPISAANVSVSFNGFPTRSFTLDGKAVTMGQDLVPDDVCDFIYGYND